MSYPVHRGACLCGTVRYEVHVDIGAVSHCHCSMCRKAHGAAFGSYGSVPASAFAFTEGAEAVGGFASSPGVMRSFCTRCGSPLTWRNANGAYAEWISLALGTLDTPFASRSQRHIHMASKAPWYGLDDAWPRSE
jgi:hypothetical protein